MSIITDALKKAQMKRSGNNAEELNNPPDPEKNPEQFLAAMTNAERKKRATALKTGHAISIFMGVFVVLLLAGAGFFMMTSRPKAPGKAMIKKESPAGTVKKKETKKQTPAPAVVAAEPRREEQKKIEPPREKPVEFTRLAPLSEKSSSLPTLSGIMYSPTDPQAIIDGDVLSEGETVRGFKIQKILPEKVKLTYNGKEYELRLR